MPITKNDSGTRRGFWKTLAGNLREIVGWLAIIAFGYLYLFQVNNVWWLKGRTYAFPFLFAITVLILCWLRVNSKKR